MLESSVDRGGLAAAFDPFWSVQTFDEVDSTNTRIKEAIVQGQPEGTCFVARRQTAAYGRQGRAWSSPEGGLYFSFILDPIGAHASAGKTLADLPALSLLLSLAVQSALTAYTSCNKIKIKWPNDILVIESGQVAKLCGISLEAAHGKLCCGIGINITRSETPTENASVYLADLVSGSIDLNELLAQLLAQIAACYQAWLETGITPVIPEYESHLYNKGEHVTLDSLTGETFYAGKVVGVSPAGELILETETGERIQANSGEVHTRHE